jgi:hypothetical protein
MRIHHLLDSPPIVLTNEEKDFVDFMSTDIKVSSLKEREQVIAHNLVRKGVYAISKDNNTLHLTNAQSPKKYT